MNIGIDLMGGEASPPSLFQAIVTAAKEIETLSFSVFVTTPYFSLLSSLIPKEYASRIDLFSCREQIETHDEPLKAIKQKKQSTLIEGMQQLKKNKIQGLISVGNTGALLAGAALFIPLIPGIKRPALLATLPTQQGLVVLIDVGGNLSCRASHLLQFAFLGAAFQKAYRHLSSPKIGLLNVGIESKKGPLELRKAYTLLSNEEVAGHLSFIGNIEGFQVFEGGVDVVVTDGFSGNVLLKTAEGLSTLLFQRIKQIVPEEISSLQSLQREFSADSSPGAILCGIDGLILKCHGQSSPEAIFNAIKTLSTLYRIDFLSSLKKQLEVMQKV